MFEMTDMQRQTADIDAMNRLFALKAMAAPKKWLGSKAAPRYEIKLKRVPPPVPPPPKLDVAALLDSTERASRDALALYYNLHRQGRNDLEHIAWVVFLGASWSADEANEGPVEGRRAKAILDSAEKGMHLALSLDRILSREGSARCIGIARRLYHETSTSALALGKFLNLEVALPD